MTSGTQLSKFLLRSNLFSWVSLESAELLVRTWCDKKLCARERDSSLRSSPRPEVYAKVNQTQSGGEAAGTLVCKLPFNVSRVVSEQWFIDKLLRDTKPRKSASAIASGLSSLRLTLLRSRRIIHKRSQWVSGSNKVPSIHTTTHANCHKCSCTAKIKWGIVRKRIEMQYLHYLQGTEVSHKSP